MEQFLTRDIWKQVNALTKGHRNKISAIAYVSKNNVNLFKGDTLICNASKNAVECGETSAKVLKEYFKKGVTIYSNDILHSKLLLTNKYVVIGSANSSYNSANVLIESAVISNNSILRSQTLTFCHELIVKSRLLGKPEIQKLLKIKITRRKPNLEGKGTRPKQPIGNGYWVVSLSPLSDNLEKQVKKVVDEAKKEIIAKDKIKSDDINFIRTTGKSPFRQNAIEGDQVLRIFKNEDNSISVYPLCTILNVRNESNCTLFMIEESKIEGKDLTWKSFTTKIRKFVFEGRPITKNSFRRMSEYDAMLIDKIWNKT